jgi:RecA/RadA recombinase
LDSMDALSSEEEGEKFQEHKTAYAKGKTAAGSYGTSKAKANSSGIRQLLPKLKKSGSILIVISQTRDNLGFGFEKKTRSGGHALRFYAHLEAWSSIKGKIKTKSRGQDVQQGIVCHVRLKKNRVTGREREVEFPIYHSYGIDDVGGMVDWLVEKKHWSSNKTGFISATEFNLNLRREDLVQKIEGTDLLMKMKGIVGQVWNQIEEETALQRKPRYT